MSRLPDFSTRPRRRAPAALELVLILAGLTLLAAAAQAAWNSERQLRRAQVEIEQARLDVAGLTARIRTFESRREAAVEALVARMLFTAEAPPPHVVAKLGALLPSDVRLDGLTLEYGRRIELDLRIAARRAAAYDLFLQRLGASPLFEGLVPGVENRDGEVVASVRVSYRGEVAP